MTVDHLRFQSQPEFSRYPFSLPFYATKMFLNLYPRKDILLIDGGVFQGRFAKEFERAHFDEEYPDRSFSIIGYEPNPANYERLISEPPVEPEQAADRFRIEFREFALSSKDGKETFNLPVRALDNDVSPGGWLDSGPTYSRKSRDIEVDAVRLESELEYSPTLIKLDLQGGELRALQGAGDLLQECPLLWVEAFLMRRASSKLCGFLDEAGFDIYHGDYQVGYSDIDTALRSLSLLGANETEIDEVYSCMHTRITSGFEKEMFVDGYDGMLDGVTYIATDFLCVNRNFTRLADYLKQT